MGDRTRNIAIQLVLQQCCKTSCTFFVARFTERLKPTDVFVVLVAVAVKHYTILYFCLSKLFF